MALDDAAHGSFRVAQDKCGPNCLLARGMLGGDIKQLLGSFWLVMAELMY
jgi:hypothetical protein